MSVRLLAGPFPIVGADGTVMGGSDWMWYPGVGLLGFGYGPGAFGGFFGGFYRVALDGIVSAEVISFGLHQVLSWWPSRQWLILLEIERQPDGSLLYSEHVWEPIAMMEQKTDPAGWLTQTEVAASQIRFRQYVKLVDRRIYTDSVRVWRQVDGVTPDVVECTNLPFYFGTLLPGRSEHDVFAPGGSGDVTKGCFYDTLTCTVTSPVYQIDPTISGLQFLGYAPEHGVLFSIHRGDTNVDPHFIRVWSLEVETTILTDPEVFIGTPESGQVVTYRVRVTGDQDDPAEGELVNWELAGAGTLLDIQTVSDADGYATARVQYLLGETGPSTVKASVLC